MPFVLQNVVPKLTRLNLNPSKYNEHTSYFQQYLSRIKRNRTKMERSDSTETLPDNSDRSYKSRCSSIDDIVEYSMKSEFQIEQQLYDELREQVNSCQIPATDDYDMLNAPNSIEPPASYVSTLDSFDFKEKITSDAEIKRETIQKPNFESPCSVNNVLNNIRQICTSSNNNNSTNNNNSIDTVNKINGGQIICRDQSLLNPNNIKSKQSVISKRRLDYSKTISARNQKTMSFRDEKNKKSRLEKQANITTNNVMSVKQIKKNVIENDGVGNGGRGNKLHDYNEFRRWNANNAKIFNQEMLRKELKYLRDRHLSDAVLANEIRKMTLSS